MSSTHMQETPAQPQPVDQPAPQSTASPGKANTGRVLTIVGFVLSGLALLFAPVILGPIGAVLGGLGMKQGDPLGKWAIVTGIVGTILGMALAYIVFNAAAQ